MYRIKLFIITFYLLFQTVNLFSQKEIIKITGSDVMYPLIKELKNNYEKVYKTKVIIEKNQTDFEIAELFGKGYDIVMTPRLLTQDEIDKYKYKTICYDGIIFIINKDNPLENISLNQIRDIYTGKITNWKSLNSINSEIIVTTQNYNNKEYKIFKNYTHVYALDDNDINKDKIIGFIKYDAISFNSNLQVMVFVASIPSAIGYISLNDYININKELIDVKYIAVDSIAPFDGKKLNKKYPFVREFNLVFLNFNDKINKFLNSIFNENGKNIIKNFNYFPIE